MKLCSRCKKIKPLSQFNFKIKSKGIYSYHCKLCSREYIRGHYLKNRDYYLKKAKRINDHKRKQIKEYIWNYLLTNHCVDCGENDPVVLEFDHLRDKLFNISAFSRGRTLETVAFEITKCAVRCANCHRRKTANQFGWHKEFMPL